MTVEDIPTPSTVIHAYNTVLEISWIFVSSGTNRFYNTEETFTLIQNRITEFIFKLYVPFLRVFESQDINDIILRPPGIPFQPRTTVESSYTFPTSLFPTLFLKFPSTVTDFNKILYSILIYLCNCRSWSSCDTVYFLILF